MKTQSVKYWMNKLGKNANYDAKDENELSFKKIAEYFISRGNNKNIAA